MHASSWDDFALRVDLPVHEEWFGRDQTVTLGGVRHLALPDNGYQLLVAWSAGPLRACRTAEARPHPEAPADRAVVDEVVNGYLADAGAPPRPRGFAWFVELPAPLTPQDLWAAVALPGRHGEPVDLTAVVTAMRTGLRRLYAG